MLQMYKCYGTSTLHNIQKFYICSKVVRLAFLFEFSLSKIFHKNTTALPKVKPSDLNIL